MTAAGRERQGHSRWSALSRAELAHASGLLARLEDLTARQRRAISTMAGAELASLASEQVELESELRMLLEQPRDGGEPASPEDRAAIVALSARVRRACQHNVGLLAHARRSVSLLLGYDEERVAYDRRARRLTRPMKAPVGAL